LPRPVFVLVAGVNGAGKSTLTRSIKHRFFNIEVIDPDAIAKNMTGSFSTISQAQMTAGRKTIELLKQHIQDKQSLMVESTISGTTYLKYAEMAKEAGYRTVFIYVALDSAESSAERVAKRVRLGGHPIPLDHVQRRYPKSMNNIKSFISVFESAHIYNNSDHYQWIAGFRNGIIHNSIPNIPDWLKRFII